MNARFPHGLPAMHDLLRWPSRRLPAVTMDAERLLAAQLRERLAVAVFVVCGYQDLAGRGSR